MCAKRVSKELHDAFENDIDIDLSREGLVTDVEGVPEGEAREEEETSERELIERVRPSDMLPDRFQPRPILPLEFHQQFFKGEFDCYQVAAKWLKMSDEDKGHKRRVAELIFLPHSESSGLNIRENNCVVVIRKWLTHYFFFIFTASKIHRYKRDERDGREKFFHRNKVNKVASKFILKYLFV